MPSGPTRGASSTSRSGPRRRVRAALLEAVMIRPAERPRDTAALCELARCCPQGRRLRFYHDRSDYWERGRLQPQLDIHVAEQAGELLAAVSVARKTLWLGGVWEPVSYIHDLMVRPDRRGRGLGRELIRTVRATCSEAH